MTHYSHRDGTVFEQASAEYMQRRTAHKVRVLDVDVQLGRRVLVCVVLKIAGRLSGCALLSQMCFVTKWFIG